MCPNCVLNTVGLSAGVYTAFGICGVFFVIGVLAMWWAFRNGEFEDVEGVKFEMMDDSENGQLGAKAKVAVEKARAAQQEVVRAEMAEVAKQATEVAPEEHYEEVSEYRIGEGPPPLFLVIAFALIVLYAAFSWIPLFGY